MNIITIKGPKILAHYRGIFSGYVPEYGAKIRHKFDCTH